MANWICTQQGAREHYAIPRALASVGRLGGLITDAWVHPGSWFARLSGGLGKRLAGRYHPELAGQKIAAFTKQFARIELSQRIRRRSGVAFYIARNDVFDRACAQIVERDDSPPGSVFFGFCHANRHAFPVAKAKGFRTILGQFDPGPREQDIVERECEARPEIQTTWQRYSAELVASWREEVVLSDAVIVNSAWSRECLVATGVPLEKIVVVPLVYTTGAPRGITREYPARFTRERPFRVLFLGQVNLRKGIARLLDAAKILIGRPVEIRLVGPTDISNLAELSRGLPVKYYGPVPRAEVEQHYREADIFILPTLSDGYAITQLEAMAWGLPVIASRYCGSVVQHERNGIILSEPTGEEIAATLDKFIEKPESLRRLSAGISAPDFGLDQLAQTLIEMETDP